MKAHLERDADVGRRVGEKTSLREGVCGTVVPGTRNGGRGVRRVLTLRGEVKYPSPGALGRRDEWPEPGRLGPTRRVARPGSK